MSNPKSNSITTKITELDAQIQWFYSDEFSLDEAESRYKAALKLHQEIEQDLSALKNKITVLNVAK
ncbi:hypothetical protein IJ095_03000 [Candidatus Saccharibacteria bacterium]|nr:hypothetical protein [Candidatus Saccharibacteria bacterium]